MQHFGKEAGLIEKAVLVQRVFFLGELVLLKRFLRLREKAKAIPEIGSHIGIVSAKRDRFLIMFDRVGPVLPIVVPVGQRSRRCGGCEL